MRLIINKENSDLFAMDILAPLGTQRSVTVPGEQVERFAADIEGFDYDTFEGYGSQVGDMADDIWKQWLSVFENEIVIDFETAELNADALRMLRDRTDNQAYKSAFDRLIPLANGELGDDLTVMLGYTTDVWPNEIKLTAIDYLADHVDKMTVPQAGQLANHYNALGDADLSNMQQTANARANQILIEADINAYLGDRMLQLAIYRAKKANENEKVTA